MRRLAFLASISMLAASAALAVEDNTGAWAGVSATGSFAPEDADHRWRYSLDAQHRFFDIGSGITQSLIRPALGYSLRGGISVWIGYAYLNSRRTSGERIEEHRPWQQVNWTALSHPRGNLAFRLRLEQRFLETGDDVGWVFRGQARYVHHLGERSRWQAVGFIEPFVALNETDWGGDSGLTQNRIFLGLAYRMTRSMSLEFGYMNQFIRLTGEDLANHLAVAQLKFRR